MNEYNVKQKINNNSIPPTIYSENKNKSCILIAEKDGKYGIIDSNSKKELLQFEYDNITIGGFGLYLLIKNGKMGLAHIVRPLLSQNAEFNLVKIIPCEYDFISFPRNATSFVILRKDSLESSLTQIYFKRVQILSESFYDIRYFDTDFIFAVDKDNPNIEIAYNNQGELLYKSETKIPNGQTHMAYQTDENTVVFVRTGSEYQVEFTMIKKNNKKFEIKTKCYDKFIRPIRADNYIITFERSFAFGFVCLENNDYIILNGELDKIKEQNFNNYELATLLSSDDGQDVAILYTSNCSDCCLED